MQTPDFELLTNQRSSRAKFYYNRSSSRTALTWTRPRTESNEISLNLLLQGYFCCCRDICDCRMLNVLLQGYCRRAGGRRDRSGGQSERGLQVVFLTIWTQNFIWWQSAWIIMYFSGKLLTWLMLTNQEAWIGENIFCFAIVLLPIGCDGCTKGWDGSPSNNWTEQLLLHEQLSSFNLREELVAWLDLCGAEINVSKITGSFILLHQQILDSVKYQAHAYIWDIVT